MQNRAQLLGSAWVKTSSMRVQRVQEGTSSSAHGGSTTTLERLSRDTRANDSPAELPRPRQGSAKTFYSCDSVVLQEVHEAFERRRLSQTSAFQGRGLGGAVFHLRPDAHACSSSLADEPDVNSRLTGPRTSAPEQRRGLTRHGSLRGHGHRILLALEMNRRRCRQHEPGHMARRELRQRHLHMHSIV